MEAKFTSVWSEESEMIAHLQSMFWTNTDADINLPSPNTADINLPSPNTSADSCVTTSTMPNSLRPIESECYSAVPLVNIAVDFSLVHQTETVAATTNAVAGDKRVFHIDDQRNKSKNTNKKPCTVSQLSKTLSSNTLNGDASTHLANLNSSWGCSSEDDSISLCEEYVALKQIDSAKGRSRCSKNSQSLYAKKRRERINEKLRVLQKLIPNGTKVDISTMLEEAVQYVKFLQLQIKLLSSDETWMYAPLAYNGVGIDFSATTSDK